MDKHDQPLDIANVQYAKHTLDDGRTQLNINGHINHEYYETTITVSDEVFSDADYFNTFLKQSLLAAREKVKGLKDK